MATSSRDTPDPLGTGAGSHTMPSSISPLQSLSTVSQTSTAPGLMDESR
jgi:hypothetical protein